MAWERKIMRTVRIRNEQNPGTLAQLVTAISDMGASVGTINLISETTRSVVRDITVYADNVEHMDKVVEAMHANPGTHIIEVRDEVLAAYQGQDRHPLALSR